MKYLLEGMVEKNKEYSGIWNIRSFTKSKCYFCFMSTEPDACERKESVANAEKRNPRCRRG